MPGDTSLPTSHTPSPRIVPLGVEKLVESPPASEDEVAGIEGDSGTSDPVVVAVAVTVAVTTDLFAGAARGPAVDEHPAISATNSVAPTTENRTPSARRLHPLRLVPMADIFCHRLETCHLRGGGRSRASARKRRERGTLVNRLSQGGPHVHRCAASTSQSSPGAPRRRLASRLARSVATRPRRVAGLRPVQHRSRLTASALVGAAEVKPSPTLPPGVRHNLQLLPAELSAALTLVRTTYVRQRVDRACVAV